MAGTFSLATPNSGPFMEFKGNADLPVEAPDSPLKTVGGVVRCPAGPGFGVKVDPDFEGPARHRGVNVRCAGATVATMGSGTP